MARDDDGGKFWNLVIGAVAGAAIGFIGSVAGDLISGKSLSEVDWGRAGISAAIGAVSGLVVATGLGSAAQAIIAAGLNAADNAVGQVRANGGTKNLKFNIGECVMAGVIGGVSSIGGTFAGKATDAAAEASRLLKNGAHYLSHSNAKLGLRAINNSKLYTNIVRGVASVSGSIATGVSNTYYTIMKKIFKK